MIRGGENQITEIGDDGKYGRFSARANLSDVREYVPPGDLIWLPENKGRGIAQSGFHWKDNTKAGVYALQYQPFYSENIGAVTLRIV